MVNVRQSETNPSSSGRCWDAGASMAGEQQRMIGISIQNPDPEEVGRMQSQLQASDAANQAVSPSGLWKAALPLQIFMKIVGTTQLASLRTNG